MFEYNEELLQTDLRLRLLPLIINFNTMPINQFHSTWLQSTNEWDDMSQLLQSREAIPDISRYIMRRYRLKSAWVHDFTELRHRILLIDGVCLNRLACLLGLIVFSRYIRKIIDGEILKVLRESLGEDFFEFARKRAAFYNPQFLNRMIKVDPNKIGPHNIVDEVRKKGVICFGLLFWNDEKNLKTRLAIKLPKQYAPQILRDPPKGASTERLNEFRDGIFKIVIKLIKEAEPTWQTIFV